MRLIVSGGGTGGHIYPALAIIEDLMSQEPDSEVLYVGSKRGLEGDIVPRQNIPFVSLQIQGFSRSMSFSGIKTNLQTIQLFLKSVRKAKKIIRDFKPDLVIGTGGYVSGAVVYAASRMKVPAMIHEQNSVVGLTNKFLSHFVDKIAIGFPEAKDQFPAQKVTFTGNPRAQQVANMHSNFSWTEYDLKDNVPTVLIFGGSQGAPKINSAVVDAIPEFNQRDYQVVFVTGKNRYTDIMERLAAVNLNQNIAVLPYISNMPAVLPKVDLIVGRSGATSIAEITALGIPGVFIPSPYVTADHQTKNTMSLVNAGAGIMITEDQLTGETLLKTVDDLMNSDTKRKEMALNSKHLGVPDSSDRVLDLGRSINK